MMDNAVKALEKLQGQLEEYRKKGSYNVLVPTLTIQEISPFHKPVLEIVRINPNKDAGEVYEIVQGSGDFSLRAVSLQKIGYAAGLIWNARGCGQSARASDFWEKLFPVIGGDLDKTAEHEIYVSLSQPYFDELDAIRRTQDDEEA